MGAGLELVGADEDAVFGVEAAGLSFGAALAIHILRFDGGAAVRRAQKINIMLHEANDGGVLEEPSFILIAAGAVFFFVQSVFDIEVFFSCAGRGVAGEDGEEVGPGVEGCVEVGFGGW